MANNGPFRGRTIAVVNDLSRDEQLYLYKKTAELKKKYLAGEDCSDFQLNDPDCAAYLMFLENSTRTKESFRNAALFHNVRMNNFDASTSSFKKAESFADTVKMLFGYSKNSLFIMRTPEEGVCRALEEELAVYAEKLGREKPGFINGGDGKHEHPTQEFLDEFSFLEQKNWDSHSIHIVLTGDLYHGRTVHSKVDGLKIFDQVKVDLIAPPELALPESYEGRMIRNGFKVRKFRSIEEYLTQDDVADIWYFTRLQLERMGDKILDKAESLRESVTFQERFMDKLPKGSRFYHPLPRHREHPVIPSFLDKTVLNGWDEQSINGFYTRIVEIAMVGGKIGHDFTGAPPREESVRDDYIEAVPVTRKSRVQDRYKVGIKPVDEGIVIDHIASGEDIGEIWDRINRIRQILGLNYRSSHGVFHTSDSSKYKGIISLPDILELEQKDIKMLAAVSPGCTLNFIKDQSVLEKFRLHMPPRIYNFDEISCKNEICISHPQNHQHVGTMFTREGESFVCHYCQKKYTFKEIWNR
ncbi:MAG: aspartate carbamoyltransferase [Spirochaetales bacterium]|nr:aspartate carbamoyltransferase [Spirochaetales bacterium]